MDIQKETNIRPSIQKTNAIQKSREVQVLQKRILSFFPFMLMLQISSFFHMCIIKTSSCNQLLNPCYIATVNQTKSHVKEAKLKQMFVQMCSEWVAYSEARQRLTEKQCAHSPVCSSECLCLSVW